jgi:uncharacterized phage-associated protein
MIYQKDMTMNLFFTYTKEEVDKIGNAIIYLSHRVSPLSKTKLLKLIYLIEETSIKKYGLPVFNLRFLLWKFGPVSKDLFIELSSEPVLLDEFIGREEKDGNTFIVPLKSFSDDEFSDNEMSVLDLVIDKFKGFSAEELVKFTHREHSLWHSTAKEEGVLELLENELINNTEIEIDFASLLKNDAHKKEMYLQHKEYLTLSRSLKF